MLTDTLHGAFVGAEEEAAGLRCQLRWVEEDGSDALRDVDDAVEGQEDARNLFRRRH